MKSLKIYSDLETLESLNNYLLEQAFPEGIILEIKRPTVLGQSDDLISNISSILVLLKGMGGISLIPILANTLFKFYSKNKKDLNIKSNGKEINITNLTADQLEKYLNEFKEL